MQAELSPEDNFISLADESYIYYLFVNSIGLKELKEENGQTALPQQEGLYYIKLAIDEHLVGTTFFRVIKGKASHPLEKVEEIRQMLKNKRQTGGSK